MYRILLVEDDEFFLEALVETLGRVGYHTMTAINGEQAVEILKQHDFDCIVSDVQMPKMSGTALAAWVGENKPTPFILMSGHSDQIDTQKALKYHAVELLLKPFGEKEILEAFGRVFSPMVDLKAAYVKIPKFSLLEGNLADFSFYQLCDGKFEKCIGRGEKIPNERAISFAPLFADREYWLPMAKNSLMIAKAMLISPVVHLEEQLQILIQIRSLILDRLNGYKLDTEVWERTVNLFFEYTDALGPNVIQASNDGAESLAIAVTITSMQLGRKDQLPYEEEFALCTAAFFADCPIAQRLSAEMLSPVAGQILAGEHPSAEILKLAIETCRKELKSA